MVYITSGDVDVGVTLDETCCWLRLVTLTLTTAIYVTIGFTTTLIVGVTNGTCHDVDVSVLFDTTELTTTIDAMCYSTAAHNNLGVVDVGGFTLTTAIDCTSDCDLRAIGSNTIICLTFALLSTDVHLGITIDYCILTATIYIARDVGTIY